MKINRFATWISPVILFAGVLFSAQFMSSCTGETETEGGEDTSTTSTEETPRRLSEDELLTYMSEGLGIVAPTQQVLSGKLKAALAEGGLENAVPYCNTAAFPLLDSMSQVHNATIRRTSFRTRNPKDRPDDAEQLALEHYEKAIDNGLPLDPKVEQLPNGKVAYYQPIMVAQLCVQCHGVVGEDIAEADYLKIAELYPEDEATEYRVGELRGMWSITFKP